MDSSDNGPEDVGYRKDDPAPRRKVLYNVRFPVDSRKCGFCPGRIVWTQTATGGRMPLSWASRRPWLGEAGAQIGFTMEPHFADCPNWPKRAKKAK